MFQDAAQTPRVLSDGPRPRTDDADRNAPAQRLFDFDNLTSAVLLKGISAFREIDVFEAATPPARRVQVARPKPAAPPVLPRGTQG